MEQIGSFWNASRCQPRVLRESLQAGPASADAIGDKSKTGCQGIMQHGATNERQNVILWSISCKLRPNRLFAIASVAPGVPVGWQKPQCPSCPCLKIYLSSDFGDLPC